jgi:hypothetical protein
MKLIQSEQECAKMKANQEKSELLVKAQLAAKTEANF